MCFSYITEFECTNTDVSDERLEDARKSFPSGHASLAAYTGMFLVVSCTRYMVHKEEILVQLDSNSY